MRKLRTLTIAAAVIATLPTLAAAQSGRDFKDAWFWGIKAGGFSLADSGGKSVQAPMVGVDWLITRTHGGVYMAGSETFFSQHTFTLRDPFSADSGLRAISIKNLRRFDVLAMGFPGEYKRWHPYVGAGFSLSEIATARAEGVFSTIDQVTFAEQVIHDDKVSFSPLFMGGAQYRLHDFSVFGQLSFSPTQKSSLLFNGQSFNFSYELGLRYNIGSSIDKD
jgi:hypothetical protein